MTSLIDAIELPAYIRPLRGAVLEYVRQELRSRPDHEWRSLIQSLQDELIPWLLTGKTESR